MLFKPGQIPLPLSAKCIIHGPIILGCCKRNVCQKQDSHCPKCNFHASLKPTGNSRNSCRAQQCKERECTKEVIWEPALEQKQVNGIYGNEGYIWKQSSVLT